MSNGPAPSARIQEWQQLLAMAGDVEAKWTMFHQAAEDLARLVQRGEIERPDAADALTSLAASHNLADTDSVQTVLADAFNNAELEHTVLDDGPAAKPKANGHDKQPSAPKILTKAQFLAQLRKPNWLIDGLLQRRFIYALTGQTGHAKTAVALLLAQLVASSDNNAVLGTRRVRKGRVIYFVGENPDDVGYRIVGADGQRTDHPEQDNISFISGIFDIAKMAGTLRSDCERNGEAAFIIVDTSAAYFFGDDEINNKQMGTYARVLRTLTKLPGGPCVLVLCHPIKHVIEPMQLLPRGGGAYLAEMDANLTLWRLSDDIVELSYTKIRGPGFQAMSFKLESITSTKLTDEEGRPFSTIRAMLISQHEEEQRLSQDEEDEDRVLAAMLSQPADVGGSFATWAQELGWVDQQGQPYKKRVERIVGKLAGAKPKLTTKTRNKWALTDAGKDAGRKAALRFEAARHAAGQGHLI